MTTPRRLLTEAILTTADYLRAWGVTLPDDLETDLETLKAVRLRRDRREPGQAEKATAEERVAAIFRRIFKRQRAQVLEKLQAQYPDRKSIKAELDDWLTFAADDPDLAALIAELIEATRGGINLFGQRNQPTIDWTLTNAEAARRAREYTYELVRGINQTSQEALQQVIAAFVETPGMTLGQVEAELAAIFPPLIPGEAAIDRAARIAITEITRAYAGGEVMAGEALREEFPGVRIVKKWYTREDERVCIICGPLGEAGEIELSETWTVDGEEYDQPPAHVNCLPGNTPVLPIGRVAASSERWYEGDVIVINTFENQLTITPNHPILTRRGWFPACLIQQGDDIWCYGLREGANGFLGGNNQNCITRIQDIFGSLPINGFRVPTTTPDFHGDGRNSKITTVRPNREIMHNRQSYFAQPLPQNELILGNIISEIAFPCFSAAAEFIKACLSASTGVMGSLPLPGAPFWVHPRPFSGLGRGLIAGGNASFEQAQTNNITVDTSFKGQLILRLASLVTLQQVIKVRNEKFTGHVYNLQTESGLFVAAGIITHNCRCALETSTALAELD